MLSGGLLTALHPRDPKRVAVEKPPLCSCNRGLCVARALDRRYHRTARSPFEFDFLHDVAGARDLERFFGKRARFPGAQAFRSSLIRERTAAAI